MKIEIEVMDRIDIIKMLEELIDPDLGADPFDYYDDIDRAITTLRHCRFEGEGEE